MADPVRVAVGRVESLGTSDETFQLSLQDAELADPAIDFSGPGPQQIQDVAAWCIAVIAQGPDPADLAEGQPDALGGADERQPVEDAVVEVSVARGRARWWGEHPEVLVIADGLRWDACPVCELTDAHKPGAYPLDLPVHWRVYVNGMVPTVPLQPEPTRTR